MNNDTLIDKMFDELNKLDKNNDDNHSQIKHIVKFITKFDNEEYIKKLIPLFPNYDSDECIFDYVILYDNILNVLTRRSKNPELLELFPHECLTIALVENASKFNNTDYLCKLLEMDKKYYLELHLVTYLSLFIKNENWNFIDYLIQNKHCSVSDLMCVMELSQK